MSFDSLLNKICVIQLKTKTQDAAGQMIESWADALTGVACRIDPIGGGVVSTPQAIYEAATHILFMRQQSSVTLTTEDHRINISGDVYIILLIKKMYDSSPLHHLELVLKKTI